MRPSYTAEQVAAFVVAGLVILTAYGDAWLLAAMAALCLIVVLCLHRRPVAH